MAGQDIRHGDAPTSGAAERFGRADVFAILSIILRLVLAIALIFTVWSLIRLQPWNTAGAASSSNRSSIGLANVNPIGVNTFLANEVEVWKRERTMEMVAELGAGWIRQGFHWNEIEPQKGEHWDARYQQDAWAKFDNIVDLAEQHGVRIIARLDQTPAWARPAGTDPHHPPSDFNDFGDFVYEFVSRYEGRISFIQIWNEPNLSREWGGTIDPAGYAALLEVAATRAREANPDIVILSAPMAMTTENSARAVDEFSYWQALYDHGIAEWFDVMSANVYGLSDAYDADPDITVLNTRRVELLRDLAVRNDDGNKAIWFNEYGWNASPADFPDDQLIWSRVDDDVQADWTASGIRYASNNWDWFGVANIWYFRHVGNITPDSSDYYFRLVDVEFTPRDVYRSVQGVSKSSYIAQVGVYGPLESPVTSLGPWPVIRSEDFLDGQAIHGVAGSSLVVRFTGSRLDLHIRPEDVERSLTVTVQPGESVPRHGSSSYQVFVGAGEARVTVSSQGVNHPASTAPETHTALITVDPGSTLTVESVHVGYERTYRLVYGGAATSAVAALAIVAIRRFRVRE